jgi:hypothetical protein
MGATDCRPPHDRRVVIMRDAERAARRLIAAISPPGVRAIRRPLWLLALSSPFGFPPSGIPRRSGFRAVRDSAPFGIQRRSALRSSGPAPFSRSLDCINT